METLNSPWKFHGVWKDMVALFVRKKQNDWDDWLACAAYAYNGARHRATGYSPNALMMGRRLRAPNELLRVSQVAQVGTWAAYDKKRVVNMGRAASIAKDTLRKD